MDYTGLNTIPIFFFPVYFDPEWSFKSHVPDKFIFVKSSAGSQEFNIIKTFVNIWIDCKVANSEGGQVLEKWVPWLGSIR